MTYDLEKFGLQDMIDAGRRLRQANPGLDSMEQAASAVVDFFYDNFKSRNSAHPAMNCVLARCFKTHPYGELPQHLRTVAASLSASPQPVPDTQCLTLLASRGESPAWNSRFTSSAHQVIPLATVDMVLKTPMISQMILQLGMKIENIVQPDKVSQHPVPAFNVFHVQSAMGSEMVPDQEKFVHHFGVKSVLGFGGLLPAGEMFAILLFTRVTILPETAELFRTLALGVKLTLLPFSGKRVFAES